MKLYIENILPRIKEFSNSLDRKEVFVDIPWITIDENLAQHKYIFKRDGELVMSCNGQVNIGKWEYLSTAKSLLIDRNVDKILLNQYFVDPAIMVLQLDGPNTNFLLANEQVIPDFNVESYLKKLYYEKKNIKIISLTDGNAFELENFEGIYLDRKVTINGENVEDGLFKNANYPNKYIIKNSKIFKLLYDKDYNTDIGLLRVEQEFLYNTPSTGDNVYLNNNAAPDGKYKVGFMNYIYVLSGKITSKKNYNLHHKN
ncbi:hypothetical protein [Flavobacterium tegetincola]|uniref:hypothetical protein n=1 Tax=Flavobacterium tegetincola TaxID=150172 RepID=UPI00041C7C8D|nr:hypothetical protein [Flavobacterium tegetincola]